MMGILEKEIQVRLTKKLSQLMGTSILTGKEGLEAIDKYKHRMIVSPQSDRDAWNAEIEARKAAKKK